MKTLIEATDTSATYEFAANGARKVVTYEQLEAENEEGSAVTPNFEALSEVEYQAWLAWLGEAASAPSPLDLAEVHISRYFSVARLLQMKVWWDTFNHEDTPKLAAVYLWTNNVTVSAAGGQTEFTAPPHTFEELIAEAVALQ
jgi:hypothetical protein